MGQRLLMDRYAIYRLPADGSLPALAGDFVSLTQTADELSIVCRMNDIRNYLKPLGRMAELHRRGLVSLRSMKADLPAIPDVERTPAESAASSADEVTPGVG